MGHHAPVGVGFDQLAQAIEDLAQRILALTDIFGQLCQIGHDGRPFVIADIGEIEFTYAWHIRTLPLIDVRSLTVSSELCQKISKAAVYTLTVASLS